MNRGKEMKNQDRYERGWEKLKEIDAKAGERVNVYLTEMGKNDQVVFESGIDSKITRTVIHKKKI